MAIAVLKKKVEQNVWHESLFVFPNDSILCIVAFLRLQNREDQDLTSWFCICISQNYVSVACCRQDKGKKNAYTENPLGNNKEYSE